jgi:FtsH-binding integral membrane protein
MSNYDPNTQPVRYGAGTDRAVEIDQGLRAYMLAVYNYMAVGVATTGVVAWFTFQAAGGDAIVRGPRGFTGLTAFGQMVFSFPSLIVLFLATLGLVFLINLRIDRMSAATALVLFTVFSALFGVMMASVFVQFTGVSIARTFFITAASFGALSIYGYTTRRDLSAFGTFLFMGLIGLLIAMVVNWFLKSPMMAFIISAAGVLIFAGLTAYDTQKIKEMYDVNDDGTVTGRKAVMGAMTLYLDFINLFTFLLQLIGDRR